MYQIQAKSTVKATVQEIIFLFIGNFILKNNIKFKI